MPTPDTGLIVTTVAEILDSLLVIMAVIGLAVGFALIRRMLEMVGPIMRAIPEADASVSDVPPPHTPRLDQMTDQDWRDFDRLYSPTPKPRKPSVKLPGRCPQCKGPATAYLPGHDEYSVICGFCGSLINGEGALAMPRNLPTVPPINHDLYSQIFILGLYSFTYRQQQIETKDRLFKLLHSLEPGAIHELPEALREHGRAYMHNIRGEMIHGENWTRDTAYHLASVVEMHIRTSSTALAIP